MAPGSHAAGQEHHERTGCRRAMHALHAAPRDDEVLAEQGMFGDERALLRGRPARVSTTDETRGQGRGSREQTTADGVQDALGKAVNTVEESSNHGAAP
ncbi:MAG: hypothetical protein NVSMB65_04910 [Chloroflexota bacterium]